MQLIAEKLSLSRGNKLILRDISFALGEREALILRGPNGSGKTTLIRAIAGFLPPASGAVRFEGAGDSDGAVAEHCHFVGHRDGIKGALTVAENARFFANYLGDSATRDVDEALARLGLDTLADVPAAWLSAGQRRRLGLSRLLLAERPLWLLDEPTVSLDAASVDILASIIEAHLARGGMAIAATHVPLGLNAARELDLGNVRATEGHT